ncbi:DoxX family protein [Nigerium massiliense]|uniref:DoxX family protein n=1 Tax=Nigerium massiliense TaxID=1522317 RepID=UPI00058D7159|nr:DoxX family protein [Nigerium massiliense]
MSNLTPDDERRYQGDADRRAHDLNADLEGDGRVRGDGTRPDLTADNGDRAGYDRDGSSRASDRPVSDDLRRDTYRDDVRRDDSLRRDDHLRDDLRQDNLRRDDNLRDDLRRDDARRDDVYRDGDTRRTVSDRTSVAPAATGAAAGAAATRPTTGRETTAQSTGDKVLYDLQMAKMQNRASTDIGLLILRLGTLMLLFHGIHKAMGYAGFSQTVASNSFGSIAPGVFSFLVVAGQILLPIALAVGLLTRLSGLLLAIMMGFIAFVFTLPNAGFIDPRTGGLSFESSLVWAIIGLALFFTGAGRFSLDHAVGRGRRDRKANRAATV